MKRFNNCIYVIVLIIICLSACKQVQLKDADQKFAEGQYHTAADMYRKIYRKASPKKRELRGEVAFRMAECYRLINNPLRANAAYANAVRYKVNDSTLSLQYARSLQKAGVYGQAVKQYEEFLKIYPDNQFAKNGIVGSKIAPEWKANPSSYTVAKMDLFNSNRGEFSPMLLPPDGDQIFFASNRKGVTGDTISGITGAAPNDIFMSRKDESGKWMKPELVESAINTAGDEGALSFLASGSVMYYTGCPIDSTASGLASIYVSQRSGGSWSKGTRLEINKRDTTSVFAHPAVSPSGDFLYFVSDMPNGHGGKDIWRASLIGDMVEYVENLGDQINTAGDEMFPYVRNDSTIYFASDGHVGMGGLDIYKAVYDNSQKRWIVENMLYPINSQADDFGITFDGEKEQGYFSSNRGDARGFDHIYSFLLPTIFAHVEGYIVDTDDEFVSNAVIRIVGRDGTNTKLQGKNNGTYTFDVTTRGTDYVFLASGDGFLNTRMSLKTVKNEKDTAYLVDFILTPINKPVVLENIFYDFDKATLRPESKEELDGLIDLLNLNPNVTIELSAHTDRKGSDEYNNRLSQRRAESVVDYLIKHGIAADRLTAVGKGKAEPKVVTKAVIKKYDFLKEGEVLTEEFIKSLPEEQQDAADQINRRTEFKVLSVTYNLE
ncbi:MAG: OmpA family protein [Dysgonomonas sp.]